MAKKFVVFRGRKLEPSIHLADVDFHKNIEAPAGTTVRCGGGYWSFNRDTKILRLYGDSADFGKYDKEAAQEAFDAKRVFYFGDECFEEFDFKKLILD